MSVFQKPSMTTDSNTFWTASSFPFMKPILQKLLWQGNLKFGYENRSKYIEVRLSASYLYFAKDSGSLVYSKVKWACLETFEEQDAESTLLGFRLISGKLRHDFYIRISCELDEFIRAFSNVGILQDVHSDYAIIKHITTSKFGKIFLCGESLTKNQFVMKRVSKKLLQDPKLISLLFNEVSILRKLKHPNIVKIVSVYEDRKHVYLMFEYLPYGNLASRLSQKRKLSLKEANLLCYNLFEALKYIHSLGIIHRDIKPENILMTSPDIDSGIKVCDFGISCYVDKSPKARSGTPGYMGPEILRGNSYSTKTDIFSAGIIIFEVLTGESLFLSPDFNKTVKQNRECCINFRAKAWKALPKLALNLLKDVLNPEPALRPTAEQVLQHPWLRYSNKSESGIMNSLTGFMDIDKRNICNCSYSNDHWFQKE